jgi:predicted secreted protein
MLNEIKTFSDISVAAGTTFKVTLECNPGSTGYSWALAHMPDSVNLLDISYEISTSLTFGATSNQAFTFAALDPCQDSLKFNLLRPWEPSNPAEQRVYPLTICEPVKTEADELNALTGKDKFADPCAASNCYSTNFAARPYMAPFSYSGPVALYMPPCPNMTPVPNECMTAGGVKYGPPAIYKYAAPVGVKYAAPVGVKYAAPAKADESSADCANEPEQDETKQD